MKNIYQKNGYKNRKEYLQAMAAEYCVPEDVVYSLASMLEASEDFDGLINALEDAEEMFE